MTSLICAGLKKDGNKCNYAGKELINGRYYCKIHVDQGIDNKKEISKDITTAVSDLYNLIIDDKKKSPITVTTRSRPKKNHKPYTWQEKVIAHCGTLCQDDRTVIWIVDEAGGSGKTTVQEWITEKYGKKYVLCLTEIGKEGDLAQNIKKALDNGWEGHVCLINLTRAYRNNTLIYDAAEKIKDGRLTLLKYSGGDVEIPALTHLIIFANFYPKLDEISIDRLKIFEVSKGSDLKFIDPSILKVGQALQNITIS